MARIIASKGRNRSVFNRPVVMDSIKRFNPNDPEFIKAVQKRQEKIEAEFEELRRREIAAEQRMALDRWILIRD